jgi:hypothetical protein
MTDDEYIEKVKRNYSYRKIIAIISLVIAALFGGLSYYAVEISQEKNNKLIKSILPTQIGEPNTKIDIQTIEAAVDLAQTTGNKTGRLIGTSTITTGLLIGYALALLFGGRKERLLIKCHEQSKT